MKNREDQLFNEPLLAAVLVDFHNHQYLSDEQKIVGQEALVKIVLRMRNIPSDDGDNSQSIDITDDESYSDDSDEELSRVLKRIR